MTLGVVEGAYELEGQPGTARVQVRESLSVSFPLQPSLPGGSGDIAHL